MTTSLERMRDELREVSQKDDQIHKKTEEVLSKIEACYNESMMDTAKEWASNEHIDEWLTERSDEFKFRFGLTSKAKLKKVMREFFINFFESRDVTR